MATITQPKIDTASELQAWREVYSLLSLAHHRNKNQHSHARWWASLCMLRRNVGRLVAELEALEGLEARRKQKGMASTAGREIRVARTEVARRKEWIRGVLVGKCWIAFSAVVADNQYSALGLMLLGTLARVNHMLGPGPEIESATLAAVPTTAEITIQQQHEDTGVDLGEKLERDENVVDIGEPVKRPPIMESALEQGKRELELDMVGTELSPQPKKKKKKKKKGDAIDELFAGLV